ncbi:hypothetical protein MHU86_2434 [Fragilaria crotonensis]|nr:hypothetical protein MHU86_2434 [Fragilaria crotonensis]
MSAYAGTTPSSGRRAGRAAARVTSHGAARSSGRRSRTKKNQPLLNSSSFSTADQHQYGTNQHHNHHQPLKRNARSWTLLDTPLGGAGLIVPMWVPVDTLTDEQKEQYALKQKMTEQEKQQNEGSNDSTIPAELAHPEVVVAVPMTDTFTEVTSPSEVPPTSLDPGTIVEQQEEGPPLKRQKTDEFQNSEPNDIATIGTAAS